MTVRSIRNVAIISGCCVKNDAISASVRDDALALSEQHGFHSKIYSYKNELDAIDAIEVASVAEIIVDPYFASCDLIIYHFGIYYELFNAIFIGNARAPQVVRYHNMTPRALLPPSEWKIADKSWLQLNNLRIADFVWPVSDINAKELHDDSIVSRDKIEMIPLCVGDGRRAASMARKSKGLVRILYVGRFVKAKGLIDLIQAAKKLKDAEMLFSLRLVGELTFSHVDFIRLLRSQVADMSLQNEIIFVGGVNDTDLCAEYENAHILVIPSYHEGFCKPVIEAMRYGCIPVTYDSYNLKYVARGLSRIAQCGDVDSLAANLLAIARSVCCTDMNSAEFHISVGGGIYSLKQYESAVDEVLEEYGFPSISARLRSASLQLISRSTN